VIVDAIGAPKLASCIPPPFLIPVVVLPLFAPNPPLPPRFRPDIIWFIGTPGAGDDGKDRFGLGAIGAAVNDSAGAGAGVGLVTAVQSMLPLAWG
jgi:hypothetical protein